MTQEQVKAVYEYLQDVKEPKEEGSEEQFDRDIATGNIRTIIMIDKGVCPVFINEKGERFTLPRDGDFPSLSKKWAPPSANNNLVNNPLIENFQSSALKEGRDEYCEAYVKVMHEISEKF